MYWLLQLHTITVLLSALTVFNYTRERGEEWRRRHASGAAEGRETPSAQIDEARHCTKLIKTETFCFSQLTRNESGRELICPQGTQGGVVHTLAHTHTQVGRCSAESAVAIVTECSATSCGRVGAELCVWGVCARASHLGFHYITTLTYSNILYSSADRDKRLRRWMHRVPVEPLAAPNPSLLNLWGDPSFIFAAVDDVLRDNIWQRNTGTSSTKRPRKECWLC